MPTLDVHAGDAWSLAIAERLAARIAAQPDLVVALPTGSTPVPLYDRLPAALGRFGADVSGVTVVLLDEYLDLPPGHAARCDVTLRRQLLSRVHPRPQFVDFPVDAHDPIAACAAVDAAIADAGGLDLVLLGLGANGHVGMNEPGSRADSPTRPVELAPGTVEAARGYGADPPPSRGVTLGLGPIAAARELWLLATGERKRAILEQTLGGPVTPDVPASLLRDHPGLVVLADEAAAGRTGGSSGSPRA